MRTRDAHGKASKLEDKVCNEARSDQWQQIFWQSFAMCQLHVERMGVVAELTMVFSFIFGMCIYGML